MFWLHSQTSQPISRQLLVTSWCLLDFGLLCRYALFAENSNNYVLQSRVEVARKVSIPTCMSSTCTAKYIYVPSHRNRIKLCDSSNWSQGGGKTMTLCTCRWYFPVHSQFTRTVGKWHESEMLRYHARALGLGLGKRGATQAWLVRYYQRESTPWLLLHGPWEFWAHPTLSVCCCCCLCCCKSRHMLGC